MSTLTVAQALVAWMKNQYVERDGVRHRFFAGCLGIFGHGNVAGLGEALLGSPDFPYCLVRNEQAGVHAAVGYAWMRNRLGAWACTSSVGPGATNMVTGAALATINRLPVLLLPGDVFARRNVAPVLQQLESEQTQDISVNDCFRPVSRYWDRIQRPEQLVWSLPEAMRVLACPAQTGAVTLSLPQDVQAEAFDFPVGLFEEKVWHIPRPRCDVDALSRAAALIRSARRPLVIAGGGVKYSEAAGALARLAAATGLPVAETQAGKGCLPFDSPQNAGAVGVTGSLAANRLAGEADLVLGIGTRYSDFTTASKTLFADPSVRFISVNIASFDAFKMDSLCLAGDARAVLEELEPLLAGWRVDPQWAGKLARLREEWDRERERVCRPAGGALPGQAEVIAALNDFAGPRDVVVNAAGSGPGDLHKLWRCRDPKAYHVEYGYSCMGYEIPGGMGVKMAAPDRDVYVLIGDGSYLMMSQDLATAVQEGIKLTVVLVDNHGFASIGGLSEAVGCGGFGTRFRLKGTGGLPSGDPLPIDYAANAASLGARAVKVADLDSFREALGEARARPETTVIVIETDRDERVPGYGAWWDVPVAQVSDSPSVREKRREYEDRLGRERCLHGEKKT